MTLQPVANTQPNDKRALHTPDDDFFTKYQITTGIQLQYRGRSDPGSLWVVTRIVSHKWTQTGNCVPETVETVRYLSDTVHMVKQGTQERHSATFGYLSYSAIWRIARPQWNLTVVPGTKRKP